MTVDCLCTSKPHIIMHDRSLSLYPYNTYYYTCPLTGFVPLRHILLYMTSHSLLIYFLVKSQLYLRPWYYVTSFCLFLLSYSASLVIRHFLCIFQVKIWISIDICRGIFTCYDQWVEVRGDCSLCWYWWNYWPSQV